MVKYTLKNRRKKTMKRKTTRRKVAGTGIGTKIYRGLHQATLRKPSWGEQNEIDAKERELKRVAREEKRKRDTELLDKIRKSDDYTEMDDIKDLKEGETYVEFQGADAKPNLFKLGTFQGLEYEGYLGPLKGAPINVKFDNKKLTGLFRQGAEMWISNNTSLKGLVFKVNVSGVMEPKVGKDIADRIASFGGKKKKTRKTRKTRKTKKSRKSRKSRK